MSSNSFSQERGSYSKSYLSFDAYFLQINGLSVRLLIAPFFLCILEPPGKHHLLSCSLRSCCCKEGILGLHLIMCFSLKKWGFLALSENCSLLHPLPLLLDLLCNLPCASGFSCLLVLSKLHFVFVAHFLCSSVVVSERKRVKC